MNSVLSGSPDINFQLPAGAAATGQNDARNTYNTQMVNIDNM